MDTIEATTRIVEAWLAKGSANDFFLPGTTRGEEVAHQVGENLGKLCDSVYDGVVKAITPN